MDSKRKRQKAASAEFTETQLPHNRRQQFFDCIKVRFSLLVKSGFVLLAFLSPCLVLGVFRDLALAGLGAQLSRHAITEETYAQSAQGVNLVAAGLNVICLFVASFGFAGVARVLRQLIWGEGVYFGDDFRRGIKANGKSYAILFLIAGAVEFVNTLLATLQFPVEFIKYIPYGISAVLFLPLGLFMLSQSLVYTNKVGVSVRNGCVLYIKSAPYVILFLGALLCPLLAGLIPLLLLKYLVLILLAVLALPLYMLAWVLFSFALFDKYINCELFPELMSRGIYPADE